jgi:general secretion pathway protein G
MLTKKNSGFTLIELLVVITIIGILSSIVLVQFPGAMKKANDARVQSAMAQMRALITSYQTVSSSYLGVSCTADIPTGMKNLCNEVKNKDYLKVDMVLQASEGAICFYAPLNEKDGLSYFCADSAGVAGITTTTPSTTCHSSAFTCPTNTAL